MSTPAIATQQPDALWRQQLLLAASLFAACLLGIASRPAGYSAAVWPANAVLLGLLLRNGSWALSPATWLCALGAYLGADVLTGAPWLRALGMNGANMLGVLAGWLVLRRHAPTIVGFARQRSVLMVLVGGTVSALGSAVPAAPVMQWAFAAPLSASLLMWLSSETYDMVVFLPLMLAAPRGWVWQWNYAQLLQPVRQGGVAPLLALLACEALAYYVNGPGMLGFSVPALVWCAMRYGVFPITVLNLLVCSWKTALAAMDAISFVPVQLLPVTSLRLGIALLSLAPLAVAVAHQLHSETLRKLEQAVNFDHLTGALSRRSLMEQGSRLVQRLHHEASPVAVLLMDLDNFNLDSVVERARQCRDRRARHGVTTLRATARKEEQRRMVRRARCWRARSALTQQVNGSEAGNVNIHAAFQKVASGQLPNLGSSRSTTAMATPRATRCCASLPPWCCTACARWTCSGASAGKNSP